jgi:hypothetical protein
MKYYALCLIICLIGVLYNPTPAHAASTVCHPDQPTLCIDAQFMPIWQRGGGLANYGYPVALPQQMRLGTTQFTAQLFERARIEIHGENSGKQTVHLGRIGADVMAQQGLRYDGAAPNPECRYIAETQHNICGSFLQFWQQRTSATLTSIQRWGYPLSEAQVMTLEDGSDVIAQWFERGRFELHNQTNPPQIMVTRLGALFADVSTGTSTLERLGGQLNARNLTQLFDSQTQSPILDLRMGTTKSSLEQAYILYIERLEKQLFNNYINQFETELGSSTKCVIYNGYTISHEEYSISNCLYQLLTNSNFTIYRYAGSKMYFHGTSDFRIIMFTDLLDSFGGRLYNIPKSTYLERFAIYECGLQDYDNLGDYSFQNDGSTNFEYSPPNQTELQICATLRFAMQFAGVSELRLVKSALSNRQLTRFLDQVLFATGDTSTSSDIAYIPDQPRLVVDAGVQIPTTTAVHVSQTFPVTATMSLFWDSDVYVSLPTALDKMHVTVHASEFAAFDDAYQWYRYPRWVEPYMTVTSDDVASDSNNRLPQMTRIGTGLFEGQYVAYQHLLRNNRSYYIVVKGHNQLATWSLADRIALMIDANEPIVPLTQ